MPEIERIDLVQGDAKRLSFHVLSQHPTAGATGMASLAGATATLRMRLAQAPSILVEVIGTVVNAGPTNPMIDVNLATVHTATPGQYKAELRIDFGSGMGVETVPKDEPYQVQVRPSV